MKKFEKIACNICETSNFEKKLYRVRSGQLVRCMNCGLYYASPRRTESIQAVLSNNTPEGRYEAKTLNYKGRLREFNYILDSLEKFKSPPARILDIGCYEGDFLYEAKKRGWNCYGVEPNIGGANYARNELKLNVKQCVLEKAGFENEVFDVVSVLAALEHIPDPYKMLLEIKKIMKGDGVLVVTVPTIPFYLPLIRSKWRMFIGDHYFFFDDNSIDKLLRKAGFSLIHPGRYIVKKVDLDTVSARLADDWQPNNLGALGKCFRKLVTKLELGRIKFSVNLFDSKMYMAYITK